MTTLDHAVEEECRRILLEEEEGGEVWFVCFYIRPRRIY
jgi:hypothetical protein